MILSSFEMLRPASRAASQVQLWENIWNDEFVKSYRMFDRWATDTLPLAGEYFRTITKDLMWDNKLFNDTMTVGGHAAQLDKIKVPILHAVAEHDHIVPYDAAKHLIPKIGSTDKEEVMLKGGHVSLVAGANAVKRLWPKLDSWLEWKIDMSETAFLSAPRHDRGRRHRIPPDGARPTRPPCWPSRRSCRRTICCSCRATSASPRCCRPGSRRSSAAPSSSLLAVKDGTVVGCGTLVRDPHSWSPHVGEIRMVVSQDVRGQGVGRALSQETFALALCAGLEKLVGADDGRPAGGDRPVREPRLQGRGAAARPRPGRRRARSHDIVVLGHNVAQVRAQMEAYGLPGAVG